MVKLTDIETIRIRPRITVSFNLRTRQSRALDTVLNTLWYIRLDDCAARRDL